MAPTGALRDRARRRAKLAAAALLLGLAVQGGARAAEPYPSHPLRMIIPFPPGGSNDVVGRLVAQQLAQRLGQPVVVDNRAGAGGVIGIEAAAKADPDGYTLAFISSAFSANSSLYKLSYDPVKSFTPVAMIAAGPNVLTVCNSLPVNTVAELLALAHANPGQLNYASAGIGSFQHLGGALFVSMTKVDIVHVPFKGGGPAMVDVIAGNTQIMLGSLVQILPMVKAGKLKALGVGGPKRSPTLPQVPTISEAGVTGYEAVNWWGLVAPAGTPPAVIERVHSEIGAIQRAPGMQRRFEAEAVEALQMSPAQFGKYMQDETAKWARVVRDANIQAQ
jgi:tripartite-type tricarboxylate transporter receptor subunit TctC